MVEPKLYINTLFVKSLFMAFLKDGGFMGFDSSAFFPLTICLDSSAFFRLAASVCSFGNLSGNKSNGPKNMEFFLSSFLSLT